MSNVKPIKVTAAALMRLLAVGIFVVTSSLSLVGITVVVLSGRSTGSHDFISYWATSKQLLLHNNPYDQHSILAIERANGFPSAANALMMRNPPTALPLTLPLALIGPRAASLLWSLMLAAALAASLYLLSRERWIWLCGICFAPVIACITTGQTGIFCLLGLVLFFRLQSSRPVLAGASLWLCVLKPHLLLPLIVILLAWVVSERAYRVAMGLAVGVVISLLMAAYFDHSILTDYAHMGMTSGIDHEFIPTISNALRLVVAPNRRWVQLLPALLGCVWALWFWFERRGEWDWIRDGSLVAAVSIMVAPYAWMTDLVLLLPLIVIAGSKARAIAMLLNSMMLAQILAGRSMHSGAWLWCAPAWLLWYLFATSTKKRIGATTTASTTTASAALYGSNI